MHEKIENLTLINQVNGWMSEISPGVKINITEVPHIDKILLNYQFEMENGKTAPYKPQNVGYGLSYVLPIVVSLLTSYKDKIINGIRVAVKESLIDKEKVCISYFDKITTKEEQYTRITNVKIDKRGELSEYPENLLDEWNNMLLRLI